MNAEVVAIIADEEQQHDHLVGRHFNTYDWIWSCGDKTYVYSTRVSAQEAIVKHRAERIAARLGIEYEMTVTGRDACRLYRVRALEQREETSARRDG